MHKLSPIITSISTYGTGTGNSMYFPAPTTSVTYSYSQILLPRYTMDLPKKIIPIKVYYNGKLMSFGLVGSKAECSYLNGKLIISAHLAWEYPFTLIIEFKKEIYHYILEDPYFDDKKVLNAQLLSVVKKC